MKSKPPAAQMLRQAARGHCQQISPWEDLPLRFKIFGEKKLCLNGTKNEDISSETFVKQRASGISAPKWGWGGGGGGILFPVC